MLRISAASACSPRHRKRPDAGPARAGGNAAERHHPARRLRAAAAGALLRSDRVVGALVAHRQAPGKLTPSTIDLLKTFARNRCWRSRTPVVRRDREQERQLELANTAKSRFLAMASHDLRQPLHALGLFVAQLRTPLMQTKDKGDRAGHAAVSEMNEMFNSLLDISKLMPGSLRPRLSIRLRVCCKKSRRHLIRQREQRPASTRYAKRCLGAERRLLLERILRNLVSNAVRYTCMADHRRMSSAR